VVKQEHIITIIYWIIWFHFKQTTFSPTLMQLFLFIFRMSRSFIFVLLVILAFTACNSNKKEKTVQIKHEMPSKERNEIIADCNYTFEEAIAGSKAPKHILNQLELISVQYYSTDKKIHSGQILTNKKMAPKVQYMFQFMLKHQFPVAHAIPIVKYHWDDNLSMQDNNTSSFCYRDISFSKHAKGLAIDINPYFNPVRWKTGHENRINRPIGASHDPAVPGTFYESHPVVLEFKKQGFRWGHTFSTKFDDHHFEMEH